MRKKCGLFFIVMSPLTVNNGYDLKLNKTTKVGHIRDTLQIKNIYRYIYFSSISKSKL